MKPDNRTTIRVAVMAAVAVAGLAASIALRAAGSGMQAAPGAAGTTPTASTAPTGEAMAHTCAACHGTYGRLGDEAFVPLAGMPRAQFVRTMQDFRSGVRPATLMGHVAQGFSDADLAAMGAWFESMGTKEAAR